MEARMKAKISITLLALVAVALLAVAPAAAEVTTISPGGVVFVGEQGLTFESTPSVTVPVGTVLNWYASGDDPLTAVPAATYTCQGPTNEVISPSTFQTRTGNWYLPGTKTSIINVMMPAIDVKAYNSGTGEDMTNERVVKDNTYITFRLDSNLYEGLLSRPNYVAGDATNIKVVVVDEEGTVYTALYNDEAALTTTGLTNLVPATSQFYLPGVAQPTSKLNSNWALDRADYKAGVYSFYAQVNLNSAKDNVGTVTGVTKSKVYTVEVGKDDVKVESNKDTVVRNNDFSITITGRPDEYYVLWVKGTSSVTAPDTAPFVKPNQDKVFVAGTAAGDNAALYQFRAGQTVANDVSIAGGDCFAMVKLASSGSRTVGFGTDETTKDQTYTIRADYFTGNALAVPPVSVVANNPTYDTVKVKIEAGDITITTAGDSQYFIGQEIVISGTNTDSDYTWLYITGPNLPNKGGSIEDPRDGVNTAIIGSVNYPDGLLDSGAVWSGENVETDDTWEYKWDTAGVNLDAGSYTIYAVTTATNYNDLGRDDATYGTVSVGIKQPFVTATTSSATVARGDDMYITGNAEGDPTQGVAIWILGKNYVSYTTETVEDNGAFEYQFSGNSDLAPGQYFVVVQHPMTNDLFDLAPQAGNPAVGQTAVVRPVLDRQLATPAGLLPPVFILEGTGSLQGSNAATALVNAMNSADIDDTYYKLTFMIEEPKIIISPIGDKYVGETFTISGTTNLAVGDSLIVDVSSSSFRPAEKTQASGFSGQSGSVLVTAGDKDGENVWEFEVDASSFVPDEYIVKVQGIVADQTATQTFNVLKADETPVATATPVSTPVATATAVPTAEPTAEPTAAPGFGVLVSLIGLGAVAALIARKD
jgi:S-layer glycoprotein